MNKITRNDIRTFFDSPKLTTYQEIALKSATYPGQGTVAGAIYCALALGEAGEAQGEMKKIWRDHPHMHLARMDATVHLDPARRMKLALELGDQLWYIAALAKETGFTLGQIAHMNLEKIAGRDAAADAAAEAKARSVYGGDQH